MLAPVVRGRKGEFVDLFAELQTKGFSARGSTARSSRSPSRRRSRSRTKHTIEVVVDRLVAKGDDTASKRRLTDSVETALGLAGGIVVDRLRRPRREGRGPRASLLREDGLPEQPPARHGRDRAALVLLQLARTARAPSAPASAPSSRSTPSSSCPTTTCRSPRARSSRGPRAPARPSTSSGVLRRARRGHEVLDGRAVPDAAGRGPRRLLLHGQNYKVHVRYKNRYGRDRSYTTGFEGVVALHQAPARETDSEWSRDRYEGFMRQVPCPVCKGARLKPESLAVLLGGKNISEVCAAARSTRRRASSSTVDFRRARSRSPSASSRRSTLASASSLDVGLDYLSLDRPAGTLSGGEAQRIRLATQIGSGSSASSTSSTSRRSACTSATTAGSSRRCRGCATSATRSSSSSTTRTPSARPTGSSTSAPAPGSTAATSSLRVRSRACSSTRLADRHVPLRPSRDPDARRAPRPTTAGRSP